jgi:hypothetical protein
MLGEATKVRLPPRVRNSVLIVYKKALRRWGRSEWNGYSMEKRTWIVQFHRGAIESKGNIIYPGERLSFRKFDVSRGLERLRKLISEVDPELEGIELVGRIGITSHFGDVLRKARVPSRIVPK